MNANACRPLPPLPGAAPAPPPLPERHSEPPVAPPRRNKGSSKEPPQYENVTDDSHIQIPDASDSNNGNLQMNQLTTILSQMAENMAATFAVVTSAMNRNAGSTQRSEEFVEPTLTSPIDSRENTQKGSPCLGDKHEDEIPEAQKPCSSRRTSIVQLFPPLGSLSRRGSSLLVPPFSEPTEVEGSSDGSPALSCSLGSRATSRRSSIQPDVMVASESEGSKGESLVPLHHNALEEDRDIDADHNGPSVDVSVKPFSSSAKNPKPKRLKIPGIFQS